MSGSQPRAWLLAAALAVPALSQAPVALCAWNFDGSSLVPSGGASPWCAAARPDGGPTTSYTANSRE